MPRPTQPQTPDELVARAIFTTAEYAALTTDDLAALDADLAADLETARAAGSYTQEGPVADQTLHFDSYVVTSKTMLAWPFGVSA